MKKAQYYQPRDKGNTDQNANSKSFPNSLNIE